MQCYFGYAAFLYATFFPIYFFLSLSFWCCSTSSQTKEWGGLRYAEWIFEVYLLCLRKGYFCKHFCLCTWHLVRDTQAREEPKPRYSSWDGQKVEKNLTQCSSSSWLEVLRVAASIKTTQNRELLPGRKEECQMSLRHTWWNTNMCEAGIHRDPIRHISLNIWLDQPTDYTFLSTHSVNSSL